MRPLSYGIVLLASLALASPAVAQLGTRPGSPPTQVKPVPVRQLPVIKPVPPKPGPRPTPGVPEPGAIALFGLGALLVGGAVRRRSRR